jgi:hypothetical protein
MVVWRYHGTEPPAEHVTHMHTLLREVATRVLGGECYIDDNMRNIPDHYHAHGRPKGGFFGPGAGASASAPTSGGFHGGERAASQGQRDPAPAAG